MKMKTSIEENLNVGDDEDSFDSCQDSDDEDFFDSWQDGDSV